MLHAAAIDGVLAVKNGPPGMWRGLSSPAHISPHASLPAFAVVLATAFLAWALLRGRELATLRTEVRTDKRVD